MSPIIRSGITLAAIAAICTALVVATWRLTDERIAANETAFLEQNLSPVLGDTVYDNGLLDSIIVIPLPHELPASGAVTVYRVYESGRPVAALFAITARDGYAGPIDLLVGISYGGAVTGVRVLTHRETPGLGDGIETAKSDWILQFDGRSLSDPLPGAWAIRADGGEFDQLTGASVTPRAIIKAIRETLIYFDANRDALFAAPAVGGAET